MVMLVASFLHAISSVQCFCVCGRFGHACVIQHTATPQHCCSCICCGMCSWVPMQHSVSSVKATMCAAGSSLHVLTMPPRAQPLPATVLTPPLLCLHTSVPHPAAPPQLCPQQHPLDHQQWRTSMEQQQQPHGWGAWPHPAGGLPPGGEVGQLRQGAHP
jgi:hypothetical protein